jgi:hypothetical protein
MKRLFSRRPSAAMIVAMVALVAALAGTAIAGGPFLKKSKFKKFKSTAVTRLTYVNTTSNVPVGSGNDFTTVSANCPAGYHPVGGGVKLLSPDQNFWWDDGYLTPSGYASKIANNSGTTRQALVTVACVAANATGAPTG